MKYQKNPQYDYEGYTDIYVFFYALKHIKKNDIVFGLYKKTLEK